MLKNKNTYKKLNNHGSTLILAVAAIAFISIIAMTIICAASANLALKRAQINADRAFYTAESALDEIYTGLGVKALTVVNTSFAQVSTELVEVNPTNGMQFMISNDEANTKMKQIFIQSMYKEITQKSSWSAVLDSGEADVVKGKAVDYLTECIRNVSVSNQSDKTRQTKKISIQQIGDITSECDSATGKYYILLKDVKISYLSAKDYFSDITTDIQIVYPNMTIKFTEESKLTDFLYYTLISDTDVSFEGTGINVASSIYAGKNINLTDNSSVQFIGQMDASYDTGEKVPAGEGNSCIRLISRDNFKMQTGSTAKMQNTDIWAENTLLSEGNNITLNADINNNFYNEDDLEINSNTSSVTLNGNYYGYKSDGESDGASHSSAIILNGSTSTLSMNLTDFILGGRSYIKLSDSVSYATGEGVSAKGDQDAYIVLDKYFTLTDAMKGIGSATEVEAITNPMSISTWNNIKTNVGLALTGDDESIIESDRTLANDLIKENLLKTENGFFAIDLLDSNNPVTVKKIAHNASFEVYIYYNFKDKKSSAEYIQRVLEDKPEYAGNEAYQTTKTLLMNNLSSVVSSLNIQTDGSGKMYANATLLKGATGTSITGIQSPVSIADAAKIQKDLQIRRYLLCRALTSLPKKTISNADIYIADADDAIQQMKQNKNGGYVDVTDAEVDDSVDTLLEASKYILSKDDGLADYPDPKVKVTTSGHKYNLLVLSPGQSCTVKTNKIEVSGESDITTDNGAGKPTYGIIICYGNSGHVTIESDFVGLVICQGNITVKNSAKVYTNQSEVYEVLDSNGYGFEKYFDAFDKSVVNGGQESIEIENLEYSDLVAIVNWRK
ncbi:MAG: hypothetical protein SPF70_02640 [Lachnospiraceae bacterium]|nr:hypothetical protein [Lachnospiraceae bacterium]